MLRFDKRRGAWVENPKSLGQELNEKPDDYHAGLIVGVGVGGVLYTTVLALAVLVDLL